MISRYQIEIDDNTINKAIDSELFELLRVIYTYSKNFHYKSKEFYSFEYLIDRIKSNKRNVVENVEKI